MKTVTKQTFLNWFISDKDDIHYLGNLVRNNLYSSGQSIITIESLFNQCEYIPENITIEGNPNSELELTPNKDVFLVEDETK